MSNWAQVNGLIVPREAAIQALAEKRRTADSEYGAANREYRRRVKKAEKRTAEKLRSPQFCRELGLPDKLPDETIRILKQTMTLDKLGPEKPKLSTFYERVGLVTPPRAPE